jgi:RNA polymerase sigma-70 factor (ECF subfamily)
LTEHPDDVELIHRSWHTPEVFGVLFERHAEPMLAYFARRTFDAEAAAELVAETFAEAFASRRRFRAQGVDGAAWLYGIGKHLLSRYFRTGVVVAKARRRLGMPERTVNDDDYDRIEELMDLEDVAERIRGAMSALPEEQRAAVTARVVDGRSYREVAAAIGTNEATARQRVSRALKKLAAELDERPGDDTPIELEQQRWKRRSTT